MAFDNRRPPRYHWARKIHNRNIASELVKVQPFIYTACCLNIEPSSAIEALEEPFAVFCVPVVTPDGTEISHSIKTYDGSVFIRTVLSENADYDALRCRTRFRIHDSCLWFVRLLEYNVQYDETKDEFILMVQLLSIIHEFHLREPVFAAMPSIMTAFSHRRMNMATLQHSPSSNEQSSLTSATRVCESSCDGSTLLPDHTLPGIFAVTSPSVPQTAVESRSTRTENHTPDHFVSQLTSLTQVSDQQNDDVEVRSMYADSHIPVSLLNKQVTLIHHSEESHGDSQVPDFGPPSGPAVFEPTQASCSPLSALRLSQCMPNSAAVTDSTSLDLNCIVEGSQMPTDSVPVSVVTIESCPTSSGTSSSFVGPSLNREISPTASVIAGASPLSSPVTLDLPSANVEEPFDQSCMVVEPSVASPKSAKSVQHSGMSSFYKFFSGRAGSLVQRLCKVLRSTDCAESGTDSKRLVDHSKEADCYIVSVSPPSRHSRLSRVSLSQLVHSLLHRIRDSVHSRCCRWKRARLIRKAVPSWIQSPRFDLLTSFSAGWPSLSSSFSNPTDAYEPCLSSGSVDLQLTQTTPSIQSLPSRLPTLLAYPTHDRSTLTDAEATLRRVVKGVAVVTRIKLCPASTFALQQLTESFH